MHDQAMGTTHIELDQIGRRRWRLVVMRDGWVIEDRELRAGRRKAKRLAHQVLGTDQQASVQRVRRGFGPGLPDSGGPAGRTHPR
jgi:hypothetical protein